MKKNLLNTLAAVGCFSIASVAQPVLTASGINPVIGDTYISKGCSYVSPGLSGANVTWDLSVMNVLGTTTYTTSSPSATPYAASFTNSNFGMNAGTTYAFYNTSSTALQNTGAVGQGVTFSYSNVEDMLHFPFNMNDTYTDTWNCSFVSNGMNFVRTGTTTVTYDGYGTLKLPTGTYPNAVRVKFAQLYKDTYSGGTINYNNDEYIWYINGHHLAIAATYIFNNDVSGTSQSSFYSTSTVIPTGINETTILSAIDLFPNPASDRISISAAKDLHLKEVQIYDVAGKLQLSESIAAGSFETDGTISIKLDQFGNGIYIMKLISENGSTATKKIIVNR